jgi:hypothetical protein
MEAPVVHPPLDSFLNLDIVYVWLFLIQDDLLGPEVDRHATEPEDPSQFFLSLIACQGLTLASCDGHNHNIGCNIGA